METQGRGSLPPSGKEEGTQPKKSRNGKSNNWKQVATDLAVEVAALSRKVNEPGGNGTSSLEDREKRKLSFLEHFYRRMANIPLCPADRERVDKVMAEYVSAVKGSSGKR